MKKFRHANIGTCCLLALAAFAVSRPFASDSLPAVAAASSISPFTLRQQMFAPNNDGVLSITEDRLTAVAENGAEARHSRRPLQPERGNSFLLIRPDGSASTANSVLGVRMSALLSPRRIVARQHRPLQKSTGCRSTGESSRGEQQLLGIRVAVLESRDVQYRQTSWRALDFGCEELKLVKEQYLNGEWQPSLTVLPITFIPGPPPPSLLDESALLNFPELSPADFAEKLRQ